MQNYEEKMWCSFSLFQTRKNLFGQIWSKKFGTKTFEYAEFNDDVHFFAFDHKYLSWANLLQKFKIVCSEWNLIQRVFEYAKFIGGVYFICFRLNIATFFGKFGPKSRNCQFKVKIGTYTNSNMKNSIFMVIFLSWGILFLKLCSKNQNCLFKLKFRIYSHLQKMIQVGEFKWKEMKNSNYSQYPVPSPPIKNWFSQLSCWK